MWKRIRLNFLAGFTQHRRLRLRAWHKTAAACGLQIIKASVLDPRLTARAGPVEVRFEPCESQGKSTRITVSAPGLSDFSSVSIRREPAFRRARYLKTGDSAFDRTFFLEGPERLVLAMLDAKMRHLLDRVNVESRLEISTGLLQAELSDEKVPHVLPLLLEIGRRFAGPMDVPRRLAENATLDPRTRVRLHNLLLLSRELPEAPETLSTLRTALSDPSLEIQLRAAEGLGAEGRNVLLDLAEGLLEDTVSAEAVSALGRELPFERTRAILARALDKRRIQTARACLEALGKSRDPAAVEVVAHVLELEQGELAVAAVLALEATGIPAAILPLQEAAERSSNHPKLRRATRQAIAAIRYRLQDASHGQLSLATTATGQLSLAPEAGQLSLATNPAGQLSLPPEEPKQPSRKARKEPAVRRV